MKLEKLRIRAQKIAPVLASVLALITANIAEAATKVCQDASVEVPELKNLERWQSDRGIEPRVLADPIYATDRNFTGEPLDGYEAEKVWLKEEAIKKLVEHGVPSLHYEMQRALEEKGWESDKAKESAQKFVLIVKDGYRPYRASEDISAWGRSHNVGSGWIASGGVSNHNEGLTVDLTLGYKNHQGEIQEVWMGAHFDEFNSNSNHGTEGRPLKPEAKNLSYGGVGYVVLSTLSYAELKEVLRKSMIRMGSASYQQEYWHYTLGDGPCYDRPIR